MIEQKEWILSEITSPQELTGELSELVTNINRIIFSVHPPKIDYIDQQEVYNCKSISGWDYIRGASIAKDCYNLGYLTEEEAWTYLVAFGKKVTEEFSSWEQLAISFLIGRYIWSGDPVQEWYIERFSWLFSYYKEEEVTITKSNLWKKYAISEL